MNEEQRYMVTLMMVKSMLDKYGVEQVPDDLNRLAAEYQFDIEKRPPPDFTSGNLFP
jgi:hypothetical protein